LKTREGEALAELSSGICQGCFVNIPRNTVVRLARGAELVTCPSCDRILFSYT
jgi:predicted  nucleic acid-binding Zn-ribbon protein